MNRGEQENLFRQCHTFRLQQDGLNKAHKLHLQNQRRHRGFSQGNIHQLSSSLHSQALTSRSFGEDRSPFASGSGRASDDLVLSVLKTPLRDVATPAPITATTMLPLSSLNATAVVTQPPFIAGQQQQQMNILPTPSSTHSSGQSPTKYQALQAASEDELLDDVESAKETTKLSGFIHGRSDEDGGKEARRKSGGGGFKFLRRFRSPKFEEQHHRRVPSAPVRRRGRSNADILDGLPAGHGKLR